MQIYEIKFKVLLFFEKKNQSQVTVGQTDLGSGMTVANVFVKIFPFFIFNFSFFIFLLRRAENVPCPGKFFSSAEQQVLPGEAAKSAFLGRSEYRRKCKDISFLFFTFHFCSFRGQISNY